jgi:hypothetical protein
MISLGRINLSVIMKFDRWFFHPFWAISLSTWPLQELTIIVHHITLQSWSTVKRHVNCTLNGLIMNTKIRYLQIYSSLS